MDKREKVIKALEECLNASCRGFQPGRYCPIEDDVWETIDDALALLKAQEPRVMTIEEIEQWNQPDVWMEKKDGEPDICGDYLAPMTRMQYGFWYAIIVDGSKHPPVLNGDYYGKEWRCWSARPTDEQREATAWDD